MRAAVYYANDDVRLEERPDPRAGRGELVVRILASGVCGSDVMEWYRRPKAPLVLGHEIAGEIVEVGEGLAGFLPGDRVVATHHVPCDECRYCRAGQQPVCETLRTTRFDPGGFAELVRLPPENVARGTLVVPPHVTFEEASFVEPLACVARGQRIAGGTAGKTVAIFGSGMSGLLHLIWAKAHGATRILTTDVHPFRLDAARKAGAVAIDARADVPAALRASNDGRGADLAVVCTAAPEAAAQAMASVDRGGTVLFFALYPPGTTLTMDAHRLGRDGVTIAHSYAGPPADMKLALDAIASARVSVGPLITHRLPLAKTGEGFRLVAEARASLKVIIEPQK